MSRQKEYELYKHQKVNTLKELLEYCVERYNNNTAFVYKKRKNDVEISYRQFKVDVYAFGTYLFKQGYQNCHIAVFGENTYEWIVTHFAVTCGGNVIVPIDKELDVNNIAELLIDSGCKILVYSQTYTDIVEQIQEILPSITYINMKMIAEYINEGNCLLSEGYDDYICAEIDKKHLASIVYTSGTTGKSKGVMLTHENFAIDAYSASCRVCVHGNSILLLPLHHTFGLVAAVFSVMMYGCSIYINSSYKRLLQDFQKVKPQNFFAVPLIAETIYKTIWNTAKKQGKDKLLKVLVHVSNVLRIFGIDLRKRFFKSVLSALGGNLEVIICGGAPLSRELIKGFESFGITVLNGYGITECSPIVSVNRNEFNIIGSVGVPLSCNEVRIAENGEVLVRGTNVMKGYYNDDKENEKVFVDGWFKTGDIGKIDRNGALHITGRIKNLIILGNGENIPAEVIEQEIYKIFYVKECIVYSKDDVIVAEVYLDEEITDARARIDDDIRNINQRLMQNRNIGSIVVRDTEFPKTTTKKIKRNYGGQ